MSPFDPKRTYALAYFGYHFSRDGLTVAKKTVDKFVERAIRLYEQEPGEACASSRFGLYVRRWVRWTGAGLPICGGANDNHRGYPGYGSGPVPPPRTYLAP